MPKANPYCWVRLGSNHSETHTGYLQTCREDKEYKGRVIRYISSLILRTPAGPRAFFVSFKVGILLYKYLYDPKHSEHRNELVFTVEVESTTQHIIQFKAYDPYLWGIDQDPPYTRFSLDY